MAYKTYKFNQNVKLSEHLTSNNFQCKCSDRHTFKMNTDLVDLIEKLMKNIGATSCKCVSGTRCQKHDKKVGGSGKTTASHVRGDAIDIIFYDKNKKIIPSKTVCLALEDMGHNYGIAYRCGGVANEKGETHIDVKKRKWYGDEAVSSTKAVCSSYYDYFGIPKINKYKKGVYELNSVRYVRTGPGTEYPAKKVKDLSKDGQKHATSTNKNATARYKKGTRFDLLEAMYAKNKGIWAKTPSGYVCIVSSAGSVYAKKVK